MSNKRTYINLLNDFWKLQAGQKPISTLAGWVYLFLLGRINANHWEPVFISNSELAQGANVARRGLPDYKAEIAAAGLLTIEDQGAGRLAGTLYSLPTETAQKGTVNLANLRNSGGTNRAKTRNLPTETAQKGTVNRANLRNLTPPTPINDNIKTSLRPSTTTEDMRASAHTHAGTAAAVEVEAVEVVEIKKEEGIEGAAALLLEKKKKAANQGAEVLKAFFDETNRATLETLCMQNRVDFRELRAIGERIVSEWIQDGRTHDDYNGRFDISDAQKHLRMTIPKKAAAEARQQAAPKTRDQKRQELMAASYAGLQRVINGDLPAQPEGPAPF